jgi:hypothetical protein
MPGLMPGIFRFRAAVERYTLKETVIWNWRLENLFKERGFIRRIERVPTWFEPWKCS